MSVLNSSTEHENTDSGQSEVPSTPRKAVARIKLRRADWKYIMPLVNKKDIAFDKLDFCLADRFSDSPIKLAQCRAAIAIIQSFNKGEHIDVSTIRWMSAKSILSFLFISGHVGAAKETLRAFCQKWGNDKFSHSSLVYEKAKFDLPCLTEVDYPWQDWRVIDRKQKTTVILFAGMANKFGLEFNVMMMWLFKLPCNVIYARDFSKLHYLFGIQSFGDLDSTIAKIKSQLAAMGTERLVCMGSSSGVFGALHYTNLLSANLAVCFAGPSSLKPGFEVKADRPVYERIRAEIETGRIQEPDLASDLQKSGIPVWFYYGDEMEFDAMQASILKDVPSVSLLPVLGWDKHFILNELVRTGDFDGILSAAVNG